MNDIVAQKSWAGAFRVSSPAKLVPLDWFCKDLEEKIGNSRIGIAGKSEFIDLVKFRLYCVLMPKEIAVCLK
jgi:hypothetical protein